MFVLQRRSDGMYRRIDGTMTRDAADPAATYPDIFAAAAILWREDPGVYGLRDAEEARVAAIVGSMASEPTRRRPPRAPRRAACPAAPNT